MDSTPNGLFAAIADYLVRNADRLSDWAFFLFIAVCTSTAAGLKRGTRGVALFVSHLASVLCWIIASPFMIDMGYGMGVKTLVAAGCGVFGLIALSLAVKIGEKVELRMGGIADGVVTKFVPGADQPEDKP